MSDQEAGTQKPMEVADPTYDPSALKLTAGELAQLQDWRQKNLAGHFALTLSLDRHLLERAYEYAARQGMTLPDLVADVLLHLINEKRG
ncbi:MAG TPA: hypothetical protein VL992_21195 [Tepidisphaeraceae bacterium]|nr:hypothetical protein [Tepidisphaeraceae bacterium]